MSTKEYIGHSRGALTESEFIFPIKDGCRIPVTFKLSFYGKLTAQIYYEMEKWISVENVTIIVKRREGVVPEGVCVNTWDIEKLRYKSIQRWLMNWVLSDLWSGTSCIRVNIHSHSQSLPWGDKDHSGHPCACWEQCDMILSFMKPKDSRAEHVAL